jgi:hypothetical protein
MSDEYKTDDGEEKYDKDLASGTKAEKNTQVRKRIDDLLEKKRLREVLDDCDDWEI